MQVSERKEAAVRRGSERDRGVEQMATGVRRRYVNEQEITPRLSFVNQDKTRVHKTKTRLLSRAALMGCNTVQQIRSECNKTKQEFALLKQDFATQVWRYA